MPGIQVVEQDQTNDQATPALNQKVYARRRRNAFLGVVATVAVVWVFIIPHNGSSFGAGDTTEPAAQEQAATDPEVAAREKRATTTADKASGFASAMSDMSAASSWYGSHGTFDGYVPSQPQDTTWSHQGKKAAFGLTVGATCWTYSVSGRLPGPVTEDPSGAGCTTRGVRLALTS
jgi:hypothetical protein